MNSNFQRRNNNSNRGNNRGQFRKPPRDFGPRRNHQIRVPTVRLIDENNENVGEVSIQEALNRANETGFDLVEISPNAQPPVCRIMDYAKFLYEQKKKQRESKKVGKNKPMKEFKFTPVTDVGDIDFKVRRSKEYLEKGHNVRITVFRRGRYTFEQAEAKFAEILTNFGEYSSIESSPKKEGRFIFMTFQPNKNGKGKKAQSNEQDTKNDAEKVQEDQS